MELPKRLPTTSQYISESMNESGESFLDKLLEKFPDLELDYNGSDLFILMKDKEVHKWAKENAYRPQDVKIVKSDVKGQSWEGKNMIVVSFILTNEDKKKIDAMKKK